MSATAELARSEAYFLNDAPVTSRDFGAQQSALFGCVRRLIDSHHDWLGAWAGQYRNNQQCENPEDQPKEPPQAPRVPLG